jgi:hypothetical protein
MTNPPAPAASNALTLSTLRDSEQAPTTSGLARGIPIYVVFKSAMMCLSLANDLLGRGSLRAIGISWSFA